MPHAPEPEAVHRARHKAHSPHHIDICFLMGRRLIHLIGIGCHVTRGFLATHFLAILFLVTIFLYLSPIKPHQTKLVVQSVLRSSRLSVFAERALRNRPEILTDRIKASKFNLDKIRRRPSALPKVLLIANLGSISRSRQNRILL